MCECCCADVRGDVLLQIGHTTICVDAYDGCSECGTEIGFYVRAFNPEGRKDFLDWREAPIHKITPDEYGVIPTPFFEIFSIDDLAKVLDAWKPKDIKDYATIGDWIKDDGLRLIQDAIRLCDQRRRNAANEQQKEKS